MSLVNQWVCVSSGVHNDILYVFKVEFETKTTIGFMGRYSKQYFKKDHIFTVSDNEQECLKLKNAIDGIDKQVTALYAQRREILQQVKEKYLQSL